MNLSRFFKRVVKFLKVSFRRKKSGYVAILLAIAGPALIYAVKLGMDTAIFNSWMVYKKKANYVYKTGASAIAYEVAKYFKPSFSLYAQRGSLFRVAARVYNQFPEYYSGAAGEAIPGLMRPDTFGLESLRPRTSTSMDTKFFWINSYFKNVKSSKYGFEVTSDYPYYEAYKRIDKLTDSSSRSYIIAIQEKPWRIVMKSVGLFEDYAQVLGDDYFRTYNATIQGPHLTSKNMCLFWYNSDSDLSSLTPDSSEKESEAAKVMDYENPQDDDKKSTSEEELTEDQVNRAMQKIFLEHDKNDGVPKIKVRIKQIRAKVKNNKGTEYTSQNISYEEAYSEPGKCNVDIVLAIPTNAAACNPENLDAAYATKDDVTGREDLIRPLVNSYDSDSTEENIKLSGLDGMSFGTELKTGGTYTAEGKYEDNAPKTPIFQIAHAYQKFLRENFINLQGVSVGVVPYSGKLTLRDDRSNWTRRFPTFVGDEIIQDIGRRIRLTVALMRAACLYGTIGKKDEKLSNITYDLAARTKIASALDVISNSAKKVGDFVAPEIPDSDYSYTPTLYGVPIMFREGKMCFRHADLKNEVVDVVNNEEEETSKTDPKTYLSGGNPIFLGDLLSFDAPTEGKKFFKMNLNPCYQGFANMLGMFCERDCTTYIPNPYYVIELTSNVEKVCDMLSAFYPYYDPRNTSSFSFLGITWAANLFESWTDDPANTQSESVKESGFPIESKNTAGRKKIIILVVNKPDAFEAGELTYLGFNNDYSELHLYDADRIDFSNIDAGQTGIFYGYKRVLQVTRSTQSKKNSTELNNINYIPNDTKTTDAEKKSGYNFDCKFNYYKVRFPEKSRIRVKVRCKLSYGGDYKQKRKFTSTTTTTTKVQVVDYYKRRKGLNRWTQAIYAKKATLSINEYNNLDSRCKQYYEPVFKYEYQTKTVDKSTEVSCLDFEPDKNEDVSLRYSDPADPSVCVIQKSGNAHYFFNGAKTKKLKEVVVSEPTASANTTYVEKIIYIEPQEIKGEKDNEGFYTFEFYTSKGNQSNNGVEVIYVDISDLALSPRIEILKKGTKFTVCSYYGKCPFKITLKATTYPANAVLSACNPGMFSCSELKKHDIEPDQTKVVTVENSNINRRAEYNKFNYVPKNVSVSCSVSNRKMRWYGGPNEWMDENLSITKYNETPTDMKIQGQSDGSGKITSISPNNYNFMNKNIYTIGKLQDTKVDSNSFGTAKPNIYSDKKDPNGTGYLSLTPGFVRVNNVNSKKNVNKYELFSETYRKSGRTGANEHWIVLSYNHFSSSYNAAIISNATMKRNLLTARKVNDTLYKNFNKDTDIRSDGLISDEKLVAFYKKSDAEITFKENTHVYYDSFREKYWCWWCWDGPKMGFHVHWHEKCWKVWFAKFCVWYPTFEKYEKYRDRRTVKFNVNGKVTDNDANLNSAKSRIQTWLTNSGITYEDTAGNMKSNYHWPVKSGDPRQDCDIYWWEFSSRYCTTNLGNCLSVASAMDNWSFLSPAGMAATIATAGDITMTYTNYNQCIRYKSEWNLYYRKELGKLTELDAKGYSINLRCFRSANGLEPKIENCLLDKTNYIKWTLPENINKNVKLTYQSIDGYTTETGSSGKKRKYHTKSHSNLWASGYGNKSEGKLEFQSAKKTVTCTRTNSDFYIYEERATPYDWQYIHDPTTSKFVLVKRGDLNDDIISASNRDLNFPWPPKANNELLYLESMKDANNFGQLADGLGSLSLMSEKIYDVSFDLSNISNLVYNKLTSGTVGFNGIGTSEVTIKSESRDAICDLTSASKSVTCTLSRTKFKNQQTIETVFQFINGGKKGNLLATSTDTDDNNSVGEVEEVFADESYEDYCYRCLITPTDAEVSSIESIAVDKGGVVEQGGVLPFLTVNGGIFTSHIQALGFKIHVRPVIGSSLKLNMSTSQLLNNDEEIDEEVEVEDDIEEDDEEDDETKNQLFPDDSSVAYSKLKKGNGVDYVDLGSENNIVGLYNTIYFDYVPNPLNANPTNTLKNSYKLRIPKTYLGDIKPISKQKFLYTLNNAQYSMKYSDIGVRWHGGSKSFTDEGLAMLSQYSYGTSSIYNTTSPSGAILNNDLDYDLLKTQVSIVEREWLKEIVENIQRELDSLKADLLLLNERINKSEAELDDSLSGICNTLDGIASSKSSAEIREAVDKLIQLMNLIKTKLSYENDNGETVSGSFDNEFKDDKLADIYQLKSIREVLKELETLLNELLSEASSVEGLMSLFQCDDTSAESAATQINQALSGIAPIEPSRKYANYLANCLLNLYTKLGYEGYVKTYAIKVEKDLAGNITFSATYPPVVYGSGNLLDSKNSRIGKLIISDALFSDGYFTSACENAVHTEYKKKEGETEAQLVFVDEKEIKRLARRIGWQNTFNGVITQFAQTFAKLWETCHITQEELNVKDKGIWAGGDSDPEKLAYDEYKKIFYNSNNALNTTNLVNCIQKHSTDFSMEKYLWGLALKKQGNTTKGYGAGKHEYYKNDDENFKEANIEFSAGTGHLTFNDYADNYSNKSVLSYFLYHSLIPSETKTWSEKTFKSTKFDDPYLKIKTNDKSALKVVTDSNHEVTLQPSDSAATETINDLITRNIKGVKGVNWETYTSNIEILREQLNMVLVDYIYATDDSSEGSGRINNPYYDEDLIDEDETEDVNNANSESEKANYTSTETKDEKDLPIDERRTETLENLINSINVYPQFCLVFRGFVKEIINKDLAVEFEDMEEKLLSHKSITKYLEEKLTDCYKYDKFLTVSTMVEEKNDKGEVVDIEKKYESKESELNQIKTKLKGYRDKLKSQYDSLNTKVETIENKLKEINVTNKKVDENKALVEAMQFASTIPSGLLSLKKTEVAAKTYSTSTEPSIYDIYSIKQDIRSVASYIGRETVTDNEIDAKQRLKYLVDNTSNTKSEAVRGRMVWLIEPDAGGNIFKGNIVSTIPQNFNRDNLWYAIENTGEELEGDYSNDNLDKLDISDVEKLIYRLLGDGAENQLDHTDEDSSSEEKKWGYVVIPKRLNTDEGEAKSSDGSSLTDTISDVEGDLFYIFQKKIKPDPTVNTSNKNSAPTSNDADALESLEFKPKAAITKKGDLLPVRLLKDEPTVQIEEDNSEDGEINFAGVGDIDIEISPMEQPYIEFEIIKNKKDKSKKDGNVETEVFREFFDNPNDTKSFSISPESHKYEQSKDGSQDIFVFKAILHNVEVYRYELEDVSIEDAASLSHTRRFDFSADTVKGVTELAGDDLKLTGNIGRQNSDDVYFGIQSGTIKMESRSYGPADANFVVETQDGKSTNHSWWGADEKSEGITAAGFIRKFFSIIRRTYYQFIEFLAPKETKLMFADFSYPVNSVLFFGYGDNTVYKYKNWQYPDYEKKYMHQGAALSRVTVDACNKVIERHKSDSKGSSSGESAARIYLILYRKQPELASETGDNSSYETLRKCVPAKRLFEADTEEELHEALQKIADDILEFATYEAPALLYEKN